MKDNSVITLKEQIGIALNPVCDLIADEEITDIFIYGKDKVFVKRFGKRIERVDRNWEEEVDLVIACNTIAQSLKKKLNYNFPILDGRLHDGSRINVVISPVYSEGACISIRKFPTKKLSFDDFLKFGSIDGNGIDILRFFVNSGKKIIVSGGTGTGKTTLLNLLCNFINNDEIIVTIEDSRELDLNHEFWAPLETKRSYYTDDTSISLRELVKNSLRMFPKWIILGEVRSEEVVDLVRAFNSGHSGMSSLHADSCEDALFALENMFLQGVEMRIEAVRHLIGRAVDVVVQITRFPDNKIKITEISEIVGTEYKKNIPEYRIRSLYLYESGKSAKKSQNTEERFVVKNRPEFMSDPKFAQFDSVPQFWKGN